MMIFQALMIAAMAVFRVDATNCGADPPACGSNASLLGTLSGDCASDSSCTQTECCYCGSGYTDTGASAPDLTCVADPTCDSYNYAADDACGADREEPADPTTVTCTGGVCNEALCCGNVLAEGECSSSSERTERAACYADTDCELCLQGVNGELCLDEEDPTTCSEAADWYCCILGDMEDCYDNALLMEYLNCEVISEYRVEGCTLIDVCDHTDDDSDDFDGAFGLLAHPSLGATIAAGAAAAAAGVMDFLA